MIIRDMPLLRRASKEFAKTLIWTLVLFGPLVALFASAAGLPLFGMLALGAIFLVVVAAIVAVLMEL